jgi:putative Holliday junction resolvase
MGRAMGVDAGTRRVGIALSDELRITASPLTTLQRKDDRSTARAIRDLAVKHEVDRIVVGHPVGLDGREQESSREAAALAVAIRDAAQIEVVSWDERLTTAQAERALIEGGVRRERRREIIDQVAAALMLQSYLDAAPPESGSGGPASSGGDA